MSLASWHRSSISHLQTSKLTGDISVPTHAVATSDVDHPRARVGGPHDPRHICGWSAAVHGSGGLRQITSTITAGEN